MQAAHVEGCTLPFELLVYRFNSVAPQACSSSLGLTHRPARLLITNPNIHLIAGMISKNLDLMRGGNKRFQKTAAYGHFGRDDADFTWETVKKLEVRFWFTAALAAACCSRAAHRSVSAAHQS